MARLVHRNMIPNLFNRKLSEEIAVSKDRKTGKIVRRLRMVINHTYIPRQPVNEQDNEMLARAQAKRDRRAQRNLRNA